MNLRRLSPSRLPSATILMCVALLCVASPSPVAASVIGFSNIEAIQAYAEGSDPRRLGRAVGQLEILEDGGRSTCTAFLIADNPEEWARFRDGDKKIQGFFVGQIMKATRGQADGKVVNQLLTAKATS